MTCSLKLLFEAINQSRSEQDLRSQIVPKIGEYFAAKRWGIFFFDRLPSWDSNLEKILKIALSIEHNPSGTGRMPIPQENQLLVG